MCKSGNQSIRWECRDKIYQLAKTRSVSNKVMRAMLAEMGGCMVNSHRKIDKAESPALKS